MRVPAPSPAHCDGCGFRHGRCLCAALPRLETRTRLVLLQHVKDARRTTNTGRIVGTMIPSAEILPYGHPDAVLDLPALAARPNAVALFPQEGAPTLDASLFASGQPATIYLLDGTWSQGSRLARRLERAGARPVRLPPGPPGAYRLRDSGDPERLCTIEAAARVLAALGERESAAELLSGFEEFVAHHFRQRRGDFDAPAP